MRYGTNSIDLEKLDKKTIKDRPGSTMGKRLSHQINTSLGIPRTDVEKYSRENVKEDIFLIRPYLTNYKIP